MEPHAVIAALERNRAVFNAMLRDAPTELRTWRPRPDHWNLLEIVCHLHDEEREDFRARLRSVLEDPSKPLPMIDPQGWVNRRDYMGQDFDAKLEDFLAERDESIRWLRSLEDPAWDNAHQHPKFGPVRARLFLVNWLAHDQLHMRQITKVSYLHLCATSVEPMDYAGEW
jgi:hypothetical protein